MKSVFVVSPDRHHYIEPVRKYLKYDLKFVLSPKEINFNDSPLLVIVMGDWTHDLSQFTEKCRIYRVPTVLMMDGTIEWNHFFENPKWSHGDKETPYVPTYCDKIFAPGANTVRFLEFLGSKGKCEATGLPRFDHYKGKSELSPLTNKVIRIGVMSSNTAGYTQEQMDNSISLLISINEVLKNAEGFELKWRLRKGINDKLPFEAKNSPEKGLDEFIANVDVVICQPSTAAYEAMMLGKPTAIADLGAAPNYMRGAWEIRKPEQILDTIKDMVKLPRYKALMQQYLLQDTLANCGNSAKVCAATIEGMIAHKATLSNDEWSFPEYMSNLHSDINLQNLAIQKYYELNELESLQEKYTKAIVKIAQLEHKLAMRGLGFWFERLIIKILR
jgi:hypothetical protein